MARVARQINASIIYILSVVVVDVHVFFCIFFLFIAIIYAFVYLYFFLFFVVFFCVDSLEGPAAVTHHLVDRAGLDAALVVDATWVATKAARRRGEAAHHRPGARARPERRALEVVVPVRVVVVDPHLCGQWKRSCSCVEA